MSEQTKVIFDVQHQTTYTWRVWHHDDSKLITQQHTRGCCEDRGLACVCFWTRKQKRRISHERTKLLRKLKMGLLPLIKEVESLQEQRPLFKHPMRLGGGCSCVAAICLCRWQFVWVTFCILSVCWLSVWRIRWGLCLLPTLLRDNEVWLNMNAKCLVAGAQRWNRSQSGPTGCIISSWW